MSDKLKPPTPANEPDEATTAALDRLRATLAASGATEMPDDEDPDEMQVVFVPRRDGKPVVTVIDQAPPAEPNESASSRPIGPPATSPAGAKASDDPLMEQIRRKTLAQNGPEWMEANKGLLKSQEDFIRSL